MKILANIAERYVSAVEKEAERNKRYAALIAAQQSEDPAAIATARAAVDEIEGDSDY